MGAIPNQVQGALLTILMLRDGYFGNPD